MKQVRLLVFCVFCTVTVCSAAPADGPKILKYDVEDYSEKDGRGFYKYSFETSNGISRKEEGYVTNTKPDNGELKVKGEYSYIGSDGNIYRVYYFADENGFQPKVETGAENLATTTTTQPPPPGAPVPPVPIIGSNVLASLAG